MKERIIKYLEEVKIDYEKMLKTSNEYLQERCEGAIEALDKVTEYVQRQSDNMLEMEFTGWNWSACMEFIYGPGLYPQEYCCKEELTIFDKGILKKIYWGDKIIKKNGSCYVITTHYNKEPYIKKGHFLNVWKIEEIL